MRIVAYLGIFTQENQYIQSEGKAVPLNFETINIFLIKSRQSRGLVVSLFERRYNLSMEFHRKGSKIMSEDERLDIVEGTDEDGNRLLLTVEKYFFYNGEEYVLLREYDEDKPQSENAENQTLYIMRVAISKDEDGEEIEDFEPVDEELAERLIPVIKARFNDPLPGENGD